MQCGGVNDIEFKEFFIYGIIQVGISFFMNPHDMKN